VSGGRPRHSILSSGSPTSIYPRVELADTETDSFVRDLVAAIRVWSRHPLLPLLSTAIWAVPVPEEPAFAWLGLAERPIVGALAWPPAAAFGYGFFWAHERRMLGKLTPLNSYVIKLLVGAISGGLLWAVGRFLS
jgi:hypothetical protein